MQISAMIFDWDYREQFVNDSLDDAERCGPDPFTEQTDSSIFNGTFGEFFLTARHALPEHEREVLSHFLKNVTMMFYGEPGLERDYDLETPNDEWIFSALSPARVRYQLSSLYGIDLGNATKILCKELKAYDWGTDTAILRPTDIDYFILMWVAAHGLAASKNWGLAVTYG